MRSLVVVGMLALIGVSVVPRAALAQEPTETKPSARPTAKPQQQSPEKMEEARQRFQRGLQLYEERNYEAARVELERAYELAPSWKLLYNIGLCYGQRGDYVEAIKDLERYLKEGGDEIQKDRRDEVEKELAHLRPRIAHVTITTNVPDADLQIDDSPAGKVTKEPVALNPGRRKIGLSKAGYFPAAQVISAAGSDKKDVTIELKELPKYVDKKNPFVLPTVISWGATAVGLLGGGVAAYFATQAEDDLANKRAALGGPELRGQLDDLSDKTKTLALVTDIAFGASIIGAGISTYFTIRLLGWKPSDEPEQDKQKLKLGAGLGLGGATLRGTF
jgi:tetratricopeptide (TPR) repeat protein